jgi:hypothetical protein
VIQASQNDFEEFGVDQSTLDEMKQVRCNTACIWLLALLSLHRRAFPMFHHLPARGCFLLASCPVASIAASSLLRCAGGVVLPGLGVDGAAESGARWVAGSRKLGAPQYLGRPLIAPAQLTPRQPNPNTA